MKRYINIGRAAQRCLLGHRDHQIPINLGHRFFNYDRAYRFRHHKLVDKHYSKFAYKLLLDQW